MLVRFFCTARKALLWSQNTFGVLQSFHDVVARLHRGPVEDDDSTAFEHIDVAPTSTSYQSISLVSRHWLLLESFA